MLWEVLLHFHLVCFCQHKYKIHSEYYYHKDLICKTQWGWSTARGQTDRKKILLPLFFVLTGLRLCLVSQTLGEGTK